MSNITKLICTKNKISYVIFNKELQILDFSETFTTVVDDLSKLAVGADIRAVLWESIGLEASLEKLYNDHLEDKTLQFPMILKENDYYDLDIETFIQGSGEKLFIAYAMQKPKESLAYLNMVKEVNKKTLVYETQDSPSREQNFDLINQKLLSFNVDMDGLITSVNSAFLLFFDKDKSEIIGEHFSTFFKARDFNINANATIIFNAKNVKNEIISFHANIIPIARDGVVHENTILCQDITYLKQIEKELKFAASHDSLTGLPNRSELLEKIDEAIDNGDNFSICTINIDRFSSINETYGFHAGDMLLKHIAKILCDFVRQEDFVARVGGDEFIIIFHAIEVQEDIKKMKKRLFDLIPKHPLIYSEDDVIEFSFSLAIVSYPQDANETTSLIKNAKKVMQRNKLQEKN